MDDIPFEIWREIALFIDHMGFTLKLRSVSRRFNTIFTPFVTQSIGISATPRTLEYRPRQDYIKKFDYRPVPEVFVKHIFTVKLHIHTDQSSGDLNATLWAELSRFTMLKSLSVVYVDVDGVLGLPVLHMPQVFNEVLDAVTIAGRLKHLGVWLETVAELCTLPTSISKLQGLETFTFYHHCRGRRKHGLSPCQTSPLVRSQFRSIIECNPSLQEIGIKSGCPAVTLALQDILPLHLTPIGLRKLHISPYHIAPGRLILPSLDHLQHLILERPAHEESLARDVSPLWRAMMASKVTLKNIQTDYISIPLLEYLASFCGLQDCTLYIRDAIHPGISIDAFRHVYSTHASTLKTLVVTIDNRFSYLPGGCEGFSLSPGTWADPLTFTHLRLLDVPCPPDFECSPSNFMTLLVFFSHFPAIEVAKVSWFRTITSELPKEYHMKSGRPKQFVVRQRYLDKIFYQAQ
ncbi:hypothetical protein AX16_002916 [Volvariella volvacea WC 439]|nr:hypothetical protein AX16_002916 [Volvariella volvacea WC 439]